LYLENLPIVDFWANSGGNCILERKRATNQILEIYRQNKERLATELLKPGEDRPTQNNILAFQHIVQSLEATYDLN